VDVWRIRTVWIVRCVRTFVLYESRSTCERVKDENCVNRPVCSYLRPLRAGRCVNVCVWTCDRRELCESSGVFVPSSSESRSTCERVKDENCVNRPVCSYLRPLRAGRLLESPLQAARFVSLLGYEKTTSVGSVERAEQWTSMHAFLCRGKGVSLRTSNLRTNLPFDAHCCHMDTAIEHPVPDLVKPSFVIFDIRALWRSALSIRVPGC